MTGTFGAGMGASDVFFDQVEEAILADPQMAAVYELIAGYQSHMLKDVRDAYRLAHGLSSHRNDPVFRDQFDAQVWRKVAIGITSQVFTVQRTNRAAVSVAVPPSIEDVDLAYLNEEN